MRRIRATATAEHSIARAARGSDCRQFERPRWRRFDGSFFLQRRRGHAPQRRWIRWRGRTPSRLSTRWFSPYASCSRFSCWWV